MTALGRAIDRWRTERAARATENEALQRELVARDRFSRTTDHTEAALNSMARIRELGLPPDEMRHAMAIAMEQEYKSWLDREAASQSTPSFDPEDPLYAWDASRWREEMSAYTTSKARSDWMGRRAAEIAEGLPFEEDLELAESKAFLQWLADGKPDAEPVSQAEAMTRLMNGLRAGNIVRQIDERSARMAQEDY